MKMLRKIVMFSSLLVAILVMVLSVWFIASHEVRTSVNDILVDKLDPELICWADDFQNQFALIVCGNEREKLESKLKYLEEREFVLQGRISKQKNQTPWQRLIHGDNERGLEMVKTQKRSVKLNLLWVKTKETLKFW